MRWVVLALLLMAALAGCGALIEPSSETPTLTAAPVPTQSPTPEDPRTGIAPGLSANGINYPGYLASNHMQVAINTSYVWTESKTTSWLDGTTKVNATDHEQITVENGLSYRMKTNAAHITIYGRETYVTDYEEYADGNVEYRKWDSASVPGNTYRRDGSPNAARKYVAPAGDSIRRFLKLKNQTVYRLSRGIGEYYKVVGTRSSLPQYGPLKSFRARAIIRADGFVRSLRVNFTRMEDGKPISTQYNYTYREVGNATVNPPAWAPAAREEFGDD